MKVLEYLGSESPEQWGRVHGGTFRTEIRELAAIRLERTLAVGRFRDADDVLAVARRHLPVLYQYDRALHAELIGIAAGAGVEPAQIVVLNHYTDLRDIDPAHLDGAPSADAPDSDTFVETFAPGTFAPPAPGEGEPGDESCTTVYCRTEHGAVAAQTWDMHASAMPYVMMLKVPMVRGNTFDHPAAWVLTVTGCLGMAGMNAHGVGILINNLWSRDARVGVLWPALVRRVLREGRADTAREVVVRCDLGSGHHYLVADPDQAFAIETTGTRKKVIWQGDADHYVHTNHCLDQELAAASLVRDGSTSMERLLAMSSSLEGLQLEGAEDVWARLGSHEGYPRSICTHMNTLEDPHGTATCAGVLLDPARRLVWAAGGCLNGAEPFPYIFEPREIPA